MLMSAIKAGCMLLMSIWQGHEAIILDGLQHQVYVTLYAAVTVAWLLFVVIAVCYKASW